MLVIGGGVLATVNGFLLVWFVLTRPAPVAVRMTPDAALEALDRGDYAEARQLAQQFAAQPPLEDEPAGIAEYILGAAAAEEAAKAAIADRKNLYLFAARHLREACVQGLPDDRLADACACWAGACSWAVSRRPPAGP